MFNSIQLQQIKDKGISIKKIEEQIESLKNGFPYLEILKAATIDDGILKPSEEEIDEYVKFYESKIDDNNIIKFVPASGAASRMFKELYAFLDSNDKEKTPSVKEFFENLSHFAFYNDLKKLNANEDETKVVENLLLEFGLNYGKLPKGLLKFHKYDDYSRTPFEEHLVEAANYCATKKIARVHFTVSQEHLQNFIDLLQKLKPELEEKFNIKYEISFSIQKSATDTIAVNLENKPFINEDNTILFRPGGHGALIENLNDIDSDIIFIKNIDNVVPDKLKSSTYTYKKVIAGVLLFYQQKIHEYLTLLDNLKELTEIQIDEISMFIQNDLCILPSEDFRPNNKKQIVERMKMKLNRPIRVCGMVENEGEPGGGPFWATNPDGTVSLQILEGAQIDPDNDDYKEIVSKATHFNPVDLVCAVKDYKGEKFYLPDFIDQQTGFISLKSKDGKDLKALELPGLWNGAMSNWITIFVEVTIETFNPVKTVNDLLRPQHQ